ncbi:MAG: hypothetical protein HN348_13360, partial [Proteobacteria bacterium]|nr:hypothetical protein [Pseudomonadota bacterium]
MKLILLDEDCAEVATRSLLGEAAQELEIPIIDLDPREPLPDLDPTEQCLLYRLSVRHANIECKVYNKYGCTSFAQDYPLSGVPQQQRFELAGLATPANAGLSAFDKRSIEEKAAEVGGFPVVIKVPHKVGGNGQGVVKIESAESLRSMVDLLLPQKAKFLRLSAYIPHRRGGRLIVLGNEVISAYEVLKHPLDFRTNRESENPHRYLVDYPDSILQMAIEATHACGFDFGGVDIIFDEEGRPYLTEVNYPTYYYYAEKITGVPVSRLMIEYLKAKAGHRPTITDLASRPTVLLVNRSGEEAATLRLMNEASERLGLAVCEVDPVEMPPELPAPGPYLIYRIAPSDIEAEVALYNETDSVSLTGEYEVFRDQTFTMNGHFQSHDFSFITRYRVEKKDIQYLADLASSVGGIRGRRATEADSKHRFP